MANSKISALPAASTPLAGTELVPVVQGGITEQVSVANLTAGRAIDVSGITATGNSYFATTSGGVGVGSTTIYNAAGFAKVISLYGSTSSATTYTTSSYQYQVGATSDRWGVYDGTAGAWRIYMLSSGNIGLGDTAPTEQLSVGTGNIKFGTAAKGVNFTANTPAAGMTSQLLNWYEEGTWTPTQGAGLVVVGAFSSSGRYTRVGRQVTVSARLVGATSIACTAGGVFTTGLPYAPNAVAAGAATSSNLAGTILYVDTTIYSVSAMAAAGALSMTATYSV
jgi:hypothetical protein